MKEELNRVRYGHTSRIDDIQEDEDNTEDNTETEPEEDISDVYNVDKRAHTVAHKVVYGKCGAVHYGKQAHNERHYICEDLHRPLL